MSLDSLAPAALTLRQFMLSRLGFGRAIPGRLVALDLTERVIIGILFGSFAHKMLMSYSVRADICTLLIIISESVPFVFVILRKPSASLSRAPSDWAVGIAATLTPLLVHPDAGASASSVLEAASFGLMTLGFSLQVGAKLALGTRFGIIAANRGVCTIGPYRFMRHPMYAGYTVTHIGFLAANPSALNAALYGLALILQIVRIGREERILRMDPRYAAFVERVQYRLLPKVY